MVLYAAGSGVVINYFFLESLFQKNGLGLRGFIFFLLLMASSRVCADELGTVSRPLVVKYFKVSSGAYVYRNKYFEALIVLALDKSGRAYELQPVKYNPLNERRSVAHLLTGNYSIHWLNASSDLEKELHAIRIPLFKGLVGWRIFMIRKQDLAKFSSINAVDELRSYRFLQGEDWPDTPILRVNNFRVVTSAHMGRLPKMLSRGRGDVYPRSVTEIWAQMDVLHERELAVEGNLILRYPAAYYFFVDRSNQELKDAIEKGLNTSIKDGSFDAIFYRHFKEAIAQAKLDKRTVLELPNPYMSTETPVNRKELWFKPNYKF